MKFLKNTLNIILATSILCSSTAISFAEQINEITYTSTSAKVLQVLDGDTIKVELPSKDTAFVKLKGVDANGFDQAYEYLTNELLGKTVTLVKDGTSYTGGKLNYFIVYSNGKNMSTELLNNGFATVDTTQTDASTYNSLISSQKAAINNLQGIWRYTSNTYSSIDNSGGYANVYTTNRVNINTATKAQLQTLLQDISPELSNNIIAYRRKNPFSSIEEIKFVEGFTKEIYDKNKHALTVSTNILTATEFELETLGGLSNDKIEEIISQRTKEDYSSTTFLKDIIGNNTYLDISDFIVSDETSIDISNPIYRANISISDKNTLIYAGVSSTYADAIINNRKNGYTYKTIMELSKITNIPEIDLYYLEDNLNTYINLNTKNIEDLKAIFLPEIAYKVYTRTFSSKTSLKDIITSSQYDNVENIVYVNSLENKYVNVNTATKEQMMENGLTSEQATKLINSRPITTPAKLPIDVSSIDNKISLYTNINNASKVELMSLDTEISLSLAQKIITYRENDNFGSLDEVAQFFKDNNATAIYNKIKDYIVLR